MCAPRFLLLLSLLLLPAPSAFAADIKVAGTIFDGWNELSRLELTGKIRAGDVRKVSSLVNEPDSAIIFLDSTGGDYREGLALAQLFKALKIRTAVAPEAACVSACAIAFLGGSAYGEEGTEPFARSIAANSRLAFHAPFIDVDSGVLSTEVVERAYDRAIRTVTDFVRAAAGLGIEADVAADMMTPQRADFFTVSTVRDLRRVGVHVQNVKPAKAITRSMVRNLCLHGWLSDTESDWAGAAAELDGLVKDLEWPDPPTIELTSTYFSGDPVKGKRIVIPVAEAGEGSGYYFCIVDRVVVDDELRVANRGYIFAETGEEGMPAARAFDSQPGKVAQAEIGSQFAILGIEPLDRMAWEDELRFGVVPWHTRLGDIAATVQRYISEEPPL